MKKCRKFSMVHGKICRKFSVEKFGVENFPWEMQKSSVENFLSKNVMFAKKTYYFFRLAKGTLCPDFL